MSQKIRNLKQRRVIIFISMVFFLVMPIVGYGQGDDLEKLIQDLKKDDFSVRARACTALGEMRTKRAVEYLRNVLFSPEEEGVVCEEAARALYKIDPDYGIKCLIKLSKDREWTNRQLAVKMLGEIKDSRVVEPLISALQDNDWIVRREAARALGEIKDNRAIQPLISVLKRKEFFDITGESKEAQEAAADALASIGEPAIEALITLLAKDKDPFNRSCAARALGGIGDSRAVKPLIDALRDNNPDVCRQAARALGKIKDNRAIESLVSIIKEERHIRKAAANALKEMNYQPKSLEEKIYFLIAAEEWEELVKVGPEAVGYLLDALKDTLRKDRRFQIRYPLIKTLTKIGDNRAISPIAEILKDNEETVQTREEAIRFLGKIKNEEAIKILVACLTDKQPYIRGRAAEALKEMLWQPENKEQQISYLIAAREWDEVVKFGAEIVKYLIPLLERVSPGYVPFHKISEEVTEVLVKIGEPAVGELITTLQNTNKLDNEIIKILCRIGGSRVVKPLIEAIRMDVSYSVKKNAEDALKNITGQDFGQDYARWLDWWQKQKR